MIQEDAELRAVACWQIKVEYHSTSPFWKEYWQPYKTEIIFCKSGTAFNKLAENSMFALLPIKIAAWKIKNKHT